MKPKQGIWANCSSPYFKCW